MLHDSIIIASLTIGLVFMGFEFLFTIFTPLLKVQDCHVVRYIPKEDHNGKTSALVVGGKNVSPFYVSLFCSLLLEVEI